MVSPRQLRHLDIIDWDFSSSIKGLSKNIHWYPGTFPAIVPSTVIETLTEPGDLVFDPFGGIGTTAVESLRLGRKFVSCDLNPVALVAGYVHTGLYILFEKSPHLFELVLDEIVGGAKNNYLLKELDIEEIDSRIEEYLKPSPQCLLEQLGYERDVNIESLSKWFHSETLSELINFRTHMNNSQSKFITLAGFSLISSLLKALSSQGKSWGHIADNVYPKEMIYKSLPQSTSQIVTKIKNHIRKVKFKNVLKEAGEFVLIDWSTGTVSDTVNTLNASLLLTSPPYGNAIDYILSQKLSFYYLGKSEEWIKIAANTEIGARRKRSKSSAISSWSNELETSFSLFTNCMARKSIVCTILPHRDHGREAGNKQIQSTLVNSGYQLVREFDRVIDPLKTRQSWTSIKRETVNIYTRS